MPCALYDVQSVCCFLSCVSSTGDAFSGSARLATGELLPSCIFAVDLLLDGRVEAKRPSAVLFIAFSSIILVRERMHCPTEWAHSSQRTFCLSSRPPFNCTALSVCLFECVRVCVCVRCTFPWFNSKQLPLNVGVRRPLALSDH